LEIVVVDNASTDGSADLVAAEFPECEVLRIPENIGFADGCNRGIEASTAPWIALLNNDTVADPGWAGALVAAAAAAPPECGMLQSLMLFQARPETINSTGIELMWTGSGRDRAAEQPRPPRSEVTPQEIFCSTAGAAAYRRTMLDAIRLSDGWFDRNHFMYFEDLDLGWRARLAGWSALYVPASVVHHKWHGSADRHGASWLVVASGINRVRTMLKNASWRMCVLTLPVTLVEVVALTTHGGLPALRRLFAAVRRSLALRREVSALARVDRRALERRWTVR
jgi:GT2 family glycosyltransferase